MWILLVGALRIGRIVLPVKACAAAGMEIVVYRAARALCTERYGKCFVCRRDVGFKVVGRGRSAVRLRVAWLERFAMARWFC